MQTITRKLWFSAGHRVHEHEGECANIHGHNYIVHVTAWAPKLDQQGRVIDFKVLKNKINPWLQENWDHGFLWYTKDYISRAMFKPEQPFSGEQWQALYRMKNSECSFNPTAENIAQYLLQHVCPALLQGTQVTVVKIKLYETQNCWAEVTHPAYDFLRQQEPKFQAIEKIVVALLEKYNETHNHELFPGCDKLAEALDG